MHRLLQRQLRRFLGSDQDIPEELERLIEAIDAAYVQADDDRALLERSLELTSQELLDRNEQLRIRREELENMVRKRTAELEQRTIHLQTATEIARDATTTQNLDELLTNAVELIRQRFEFYHTAIYLIDERQNSAILMAATGKAGQQLLAEDFRLILDDTSLVGWATGKGEPSIDLKVGVDEEHPVNPLFSATQSEVALPMRVGDQIIGALNVHSHEEGAFDVDIVSVLQTLADQLAVAISNTRLLREMGQTLRELEVATGKYTQDAWQSVVQQSGGTLGFRYRGAGIEPITDDGPRDDLLSIPETEVVEDSKLSVPIRMREKVIGTLNLRLEEDETLPETTALAESVAERMGLAIENARLLEDTQRRAEQERTVAEVTTKIRQTLNIETVLETAVKEIGLAMSLAAVEIHLGNPPPDPQES